MYGSNYYENGVTLLHSNKYDFFQLKDLLKIKQLFSNDYPEKTKTSTLSHSTYGQACDLNTGEIVIINKDMIEIINRDNISQNIIYSPGNSFKFPSLACLNYLLLLK